MKHFADFLHALAMNIFRRKAGLTIRIIRQESLLNAVPRAARTPMLRRMLLKLECYLARFAVMLLNGRLWIARVLHLTRKP